MEAGFSRPEVRLKEDPTSVATWSPRRFAWVGAATAVVVGVAFMAPRWWTGPDVPRSRPAVADLTPARPARPPIAAPGATADRPLARVTAASSEAPQFAMPERAPFVDPLPALDAIVIAALETDRVTPAVVEIESLKLDSLHIEPLSAQR